MDMIKVFFLSNMVTWMFSAMMYMFSNDTNRFASRILFALAFAIIYKLIGLDKIEAKKEIKDNE